MDIAKIQKERKKWLTWKNIAPLREALESLEDAACEVELGDVVKISGSFDESKVYEVAKKLMPWRKGPFQIGDTYIDSEWKSYVKYNLLRPHFDLKDKRVADIGCNNGYYMFRMQEDYELLGIEHLEFYEEKFDTIFCLGVLYHRSDPVAMLKSLYRGLDKKGEVILDTFYIDGEEEMALFVILKCLRPL